MGAAARILLLSMLTMNDGDLSTVSSAGGQYMTA